MNIGAFKGQAYGQVLNDILSVVQVAHEDIGLMARVVGTGVKVKTAEGVQCLVDAMAMIKAGASRIGTSSGAKLIRDFSNS